MLDSAYALIWQQSALLQQCIKRQPSQHPTNDLFPLFITASRAQTPIAAPQPSRCPFRQGLIQPIMSDYVSAFDWEMRFISPEEPIEEPDWTAEYEGLMDNAFGLIWSENPGLEQLDEG